jgi:hypothetical protein
MARDLRQLARACQVLMRLAGSEGESQWTDRGPTRRASWLKGYLRRAPSRDTSSPAERASPRWREPISPEQTISRREKIMLLVAFDFWNESGDVEFREVLKLPPRLLNAVAALMIAGCAGTSEALGEWIDRWSGAAPH